MFNSKEYCRKNAKKANARAKKWYRDNHDRVTLYWAERRKDKTYKENMKSYFKEYYLNNKDKVNAQRKEYRSRPGYLKRKLDTHNRKMKENPNYALAHIIRSRVQAAIKFRRGSKAFKTIELLGCTIDVARKHIESQFKEGMSWENHGMGTWHIDHIKPIKVFDLTNPEIQKIAFHFTNLQPLFAKENLEKSWKHNDDIGRPV